MWIWTGRQFHTEGTWYWKSLAPALFKFTRATGNSLTQKDRRDLKEVYEEKQSEGFGKLVFWTRRVEECAVEVVESKRCQIAFNALFGGQLVERFQCQCYMLSKRELQHSTRDKNSSAGKSCGRIFREEWADGTDSAQLKIGRTTDKTNAFAHGKVKV